MHHLGSRPRPDVRPTARFTVRPTAEAVPLGGGVGAETPDVAPGVTR